MPWYNISYFRSILLGNVLTVKGVIGTGEGIIRAGKNF